MVRVGMGVDVMVDGKVRDGVGVGVVVIGGGDGSTDEKGQDYEGLVSELSKMLCS